jgi:hypothetical protein
MKVHDSNLTGASAAGTTRVSETNASGRTAGASQNNIQSDGDRVEFSSALGRVSRTLDMYHAERAATVQALASRYQSGNYQTDDMSTGRALISETLASAVK